MNKTMTWIRKYILNRKVSYALCLYAVVLFVYVIIEYFKDFFIGLLFFILPPLYYLAYVHYLNKKLGIWLKCFKAILLLGAAGSWIFLIYFIIEEGFPDIDDFEIFFAIYLLLFPTAFLEAFFGKSESKFKFSLSFLKFFLKKNVLLVPSVSNLFRTCSYGYLCIVTVIGYRESNLIGEYD